MKRGSLITLGLVLAALGIAGFAIENVSWNRQETVLDVGPVQASTTVNETVGIPEAMSGAVLAAGLVLLGIGITRDQG